MSNYENEFTVNERAFFVCFCLGHTGALSARLDLVRLERLVRFGAAHPSQTTS